MTTERRAGRHEGSPASWRGRPRRGSWVWGLLFSGAVAILLGLAGVSSVHGLRDNGRTASGEVVDVATFRGAYTYTLRFAIEDGTVVTCETGDVLGEPAMGDTLPVLYDREAPDVNCQGADYGTDLTAPVLFVVGGALMLLTGSYAGFLRRSARP